MPGAVDLGGLKNSVRQLLIVILDDRQTVGIDDMGQEQNPPGIRQMSGTSYTMARRTASFSRMLGMPPGCSVDRLAAAAAKLPI